jgi:hypothetical protein
MMVMSASNPGTPRAWCQNRRFTRSTSSGKRSWTPWRRNRPGSSITTLIVTSGCWSRYLAKLQRSAPKVVAQISTFMHKVGGDGMVPTRGPRTECKRHARVRRRRLPLAPFSWACLFHTTLYAKIFQWLNSSQSLRELVLPRELVTDESLRCWVEPGGLALPAWNAFAIVEEIFIRRDSFSGRGRLQKDAWSRIFVVQKGEPHRM